MKLNIYLANTLLEHFIFIFLIADFNSITYANELNNKLIEENKAYHETGLWGSNGVLSFPDKYSDISDAPTKEFRLKRSTKYINKQIKKKKIRKKDGRRKIAVSVVEKIVADQIQEALQPLSTALNLIRLDTFTEGILRQLSNLELIQSKLLTEYGELRAAVSEVGRHTLDLGRQVAGLDERLATLDRQLPHRLDINRIRKDFLTEGSIRHTNSFYGSPPISELIKDSLVTITTKISNSDQLIKNEIEVFGNRTVDAFRTSIKHADHKIGHMARKIDVIAERIEKLTNKTSCSTFVSAPFSSSVVSGGGGQHSQYPHKITTSFLKERSRDHFTYLPAEEKVANGVRLERDGKDELPSHLNTGRFRPDTGYKPDVLTKDGIKVSNLAKEIAKQINMKEVSTLKESDCSDFKEPNKKKSGIYSIFPASCTRRFGIKVRCVFDNSSRSSGDGWTVIQQRGPWEISSFPYSTSTESKKFSSESTFLSATPVDFYRDWVDYKWGFGDLEGDYWLGNEYIHYLTQSGDYELRIELYDWNSEMRWATYSHFAIENEDRNYTLRIGEYTGNAGNSLKQHHGVPFSTRDRDNDGNPRAGCAITFHGAWWFTSCHESHLNGRYYKGHHKSYGDGVIWRSFRGPNYSLKMSRMMIRPTKKH